MSGSSGKDYAKGYREELGYTRQDQVKAFLAAKDIKAPVDEDYLDSLVERIDQIIRTINSIIHEPYRQPDIDAFVQKFVYHPKNEIVGNGLLPQLNNQGRRPENVLYSWLLGYAFCEYFCPAFSEIFDTELDSITNIGDDDFRSKETFNRTPAADLALSARGNRSVVLEVQCGLQGENDIKLHKIQQAWKVQEKEDRPTICVHIDLFNGEAAFIRLDTIEEDDGQFFSNKRMEGQKMLKINPASFVWQLMDAAPTLDEMGVDLE